MDIHDKLLQIFNDYNIDITNVEELKEIDSIEYISIIVDIENSFNITIPDEYLSKNLFIEIDILEKLISNLITE